MKAEKITECINGTGLAGPHGNELAAYARTELTALKSTAEDLECLLGEAQVENKRLQEAVKKSKKHLQHCADWLMTAQGYMRVNPGTGPHGTREKLKECEDETRVFIKQLGEEK